MLFHQRTLHQFRALTNVQDLRLASLDIPNFMPQIQGYFRNFLPTLQSLCLRAPRGSNRQITYFVGIFQYLQDLELTDSKANVRRELADGLKLVPPTPPPQGWLAMRQFTQVGFVKDMIDLFGGIRFRYMELHNVPGMRLLLGVCAKTLETLMVCPTDPHGERLCLDYAHVLANDLVARSSLRDFDLSRNMAFRTLQVLASSLDHMPFDGSPDTTTFLKHVLSTITSSVPTDIMVLYSEGDFPCVPWRYPGWPSVYELSQTEREAEATWYRVQFKVLCEVRKVQDFRPGLCASFGGCVGGQPVRVLEKALMVEEAKGGFDGFLRKPLAMNSPRRSRDDRYDNWLYNLIFADGKLIGRTVVYYDPQFSPPPHIPVRSVRSLRPRHLPVCSNS